MPIKNLIGQRFGKLTVIERDLSKKGGAAYWICKCDCGNIISARGQSLREYKIDCGCGLSDRLSKAANIDTTSLVGKKFGKLIVKERDMTKPRGHGNPSYWICECECGNIVSVAYSSLTCGKSQSCGCAHADANKKRCTKDITGQRFGMVVAVENTFKSSRNGYIWRCECDCGNKEYYCAISDLQSGKIHSCGCNTRSYGERKINEILLNNNYEFIQQYRFKNSEISNKRYDFAILNSDNSILRLIEFDGEQHYKPKDCFGGEKGYLKQKESDKLKNEFALKNNIPLVRIPYWELDNITLEMIMGDEYLIK